MSVLKRVLGAELLGEWGIPKLYPIEGRGKAFPLMILTALIALPLVSDVHCSWSGGSFTCSGSGGQVIVDGTPYWPDNDPNNPVFQPPPEYGLPTNTVVTNILGVCTNCSNIAPADLMDLANELERRLTRLEVDAGGAQLRIGDFNTEILQPRLNNIGSYRSFPQELSSYSTFTNWVCSIDEDLPAWNQARVVVEAWPKLCTYPGGKATYQANGLSACNAIYSYATTTEKPFLQQVSSQLSATQRELDTLCQDSIAIREDIVPALKSGAVICRASGDQSGGSSSGGTTPSTGDWATYNQAEAIKDYLSDLEELLEEKLQSIEEATNFVARIGDTVYTGLFTEYNAIPDADGLGDTWQRVYLDGDTTNWGYQPTNILARIELLLYGLSGVGTNVNEFTESLDEITESMDDDSTDIQSSLSSLTTDASSQQAQSFGSALIGLFDAMSYEGSDISNGDVIMPTYELSIGQDSYYVPALQLADNDGIMSGIQRTSRMVFGAIYMFFAAWCIFQYWVWFAGKVTSLSRWAVELVSSMFTS